MFGKVRKHLPYIELTERGPAGKIERVTWLCYVIIQVVCSVRTIPKIMWRNHVSQGSGESASDKPFSVSIFVVVHLKDSQWTRIVSHNGQCIARTFRQGTKSLKHVMGIEGSSKHSKLLAIIPEVSPH